MLTAHTREGQEVSLPPLRVIGVLQLYPYDSKLELGVKLRQWLRDVTVSAITAWSNTQSVDTYGSVHIDIDGITSSEYFKIENFVLDVSAKPETTSPSMLDDLIQRYCDVYEKLAAQTRFKNYSTTLNA